VSPFNSKEKRHRERRSRFAAGQLIAVTGRTLLVINGLAALRLVFCINAVPDGTRRRRCWLLRANGRKKEKSAAQSDCAT